MPQTTCQRRRSRRRAPPGCQPSSRGRKKGSRNKLKLPEALNAKAELAQAPHGDVRALRAPNGDVYMWPANEAMHVDIADTFDLPFKNRALRRVPRHQAICTSP
jgi:hypothetical protein